MISSGEIINVVNTEMGINSLRERWTKKIDRDASGVHGSAINTAHGTDTKISLILYKNNAGTRVSSDLSSLTDFEFVCKAISVFNKENATIHVEMYDGSGGTNIVYALAVASYGWTAITFGDGQVLRFFDDIYFRTSSPTGAAFANGTRVIVQGYLRRINDKER